MHYVQFPKSTKEIKRNVKKNNFLIFDYIIGNTKENPIKLKSIKILYILKLFNHYITKENRLSECNDGHENNLLTLNLFFYFICIFFQNFLEPNITIRH